MIYYGCPKCEAPMSSPESLVGEPQTCPQCGNVTMVPGAQNVNQRDSSKTKHSGQKQRKSKWVGILVASVMCGLGTAFIRFDPVLRWYLGIPMLIASAAILVHAISKD